MIYAGIFVAGGLAGALTFRQVQRYWFQRKHRALVKAIETAIIRHVLIGEPMPSAEQQRQFIQPWGDA